MPSAASSAPAARQAASVSAGSRRPRRTPSRLGSMVTPVLDPGDHAVLLVGADQQRRAAGQLRRGRVCRPAVSARTCCGRVDVGGLVGAAGRVVGRRSRPGSARRAGTWRPSRPACPPRRSVRLPAADARVDLGRVVAVGVRHEHLADQLLVGERRRPPRPPARPGRRSAPASRRRRRRPAAPARPRRRRRRRRRVRGRRRRRSRASGTSDGTRAVTSRRARHPHLHPDRPQVARLSPPGSAG